MVVPDWLYNLLVKLGLTDSDKVKKRKKIAELEEKKRKLYQGLDHYIKKIQNLEVEIKVLRPQYESAHGPEKNILAAKIKPLLQELELMKEKEALVSQQIKDLTSVIHNLELSDTFDPGLIDEIETVEIDKDILVRDVKDQRTASERLSGIKLQIDDEPLDLSAVNTAKSSNPDVDSYFQSVDDEKKKTQVEEA